MLGANVANAQSFKSDHDTVWVVNSGSFTALNELTNLTTGNLKCEWRVTNTNCPSDYIAMLGICDNATCYSSADIWPSTLHTTLNYAPGIGDFHILGDMGAVSTPGPYYLRIRLNNKDIPADTSIQVYVLSKPTTGTTTLTRTNSEVALYPNPATSSVNIVYDAVADVKNIAIYSIIGRQMSIFRPTTTNSANLNIENLPDGVYFVRLLNSRGDVVATRKFNKQ